MKAATFEHEAMATHFTISIDGADGRYAGQAAAAAFRELDRLEGELSRFTESSDIARANQLARDETITIGPDATECLLLAAGITGLTGRAFDPAYASLRDPDRPPDEPVFALDPATHRLVSRCPRLHLDLGAIGKGYALDCLAGVMREWEISSALLVSGGSTLLALAAPHGARGWRINLGEEPRPFELALADGAVSASGIGVKGEHLVDPRIGQPAARRQRVWSFAVSAGVADALSTAFFVWPDAQVEAFCAAQPDLGAALTGPGGTVRLIGSTAPLWP